jgi:hypothetical protein
MSRLIDRILPGAGRTIEPVNFQPAGISKDIAVMPYFGSVTWTLCVPDQGVLAASDSAQTSIQPAAVSKSQQTTALSVMIFN